MKQPNHHHHWMEDYRWCISDYLLIITNSEFHSYWAPMQPQNPSQYHRVESIRQAWKMHLKDATYLLLLSVLKVLEVCSSSIPGEEEVALSLWPGWEGPWSTREHLVLYCSILVLALSRGEMWWEAQAVRLRAFIPGDDMGSVTSRVMNCPLCRNE